MPSWGLSIQGELRRTPRGAYIQEEQGTGASYGPSFVAEIVRFMLEEVKKKRCNQGPFEVLFPPRQQIAFAGMIHAGDFARTVIPRYN